MEKINVRHSWKIGCIQRLNSCRQSQSEALTIRCKGLEFSSLYGLGSAFTEPKVTIGPSITAGMRFEGDALFGGNTLVEIDAGNPVEISNSYLGIMMSFRVFGIQDRE